MSVSATAAGCVWWFRGLQHAFSMVSRLHVGHPLRSVTSCHTDHLLQHLIPSCYQYKPTSRQTTIDAHRVWYTSTATHFSTVCECTQQNHAATNTGCCMALLHESVHEPDGLQAHCCKNKHKCGVSCRYKREGYIDPLLLPAGGLLHRQPRQ